MQGLPMEPDWGRSGRKEHEESLVLTWEFGVIGIVNVRPVSEDRSEGIFRKKKRERVDREASKAEKGKEKQTGKRGGQSRNNRVLTAVSPKLLTIHI